MDPEKAALMRNANNQNGGVMATVAAVFASVVFTLILLVISNAVSIACIVIGVMYLDEEYCPAEKHIAPILIATGSLAVALSLLKGFSKLRSAGDEELEEENKDCAYYLYQLISLAQFGVFVYLCVLVFRLYPNIKYEPYTPKHSDDPSFYCDPTLFLFAFWSILFVFVCIAAVIFVCVCVCCFALIFRK